MASGTIKGSFSGVHWAYPEIVWSSSSNVASNSSSVTAILYFVRTANYNSYNLDGHTVSININGSASASRPFNLNTSRVEVWRRTVSVPHNSNGTKSITIGASSVNTGNSLGSYNFSANVSLDNIARASTMAWVAADSPHEFGKTQRFTVTAANSAYYHAVECRLNGTLLAPTLLMDSQGGGTKSLVIPLDWANKFPNSTQATGFSFRLITYTKKSDWGGGSLIGFKDYPLPTCNFPSSMVPTVKSVAITDPVSGVPAKLGIENTTNLFVRKYSNIRLTVEANLSYSSPIKTWSFSCDGKQLVTNDGPIKDLPLSQYDIGVGAKVIKCVMTDGRGRSVSKDITVNIQDYAAPALTSLSAERVDGGTTVKFTKGGKVYSIKNGTTELNTYTTVTKYKLTTATDWTVGKTENNACATFTIGTFATDKSYDILIEMKDKLETRQYTYVISTAKVLFDLYKNEGIGVGKMRERGSLDVAGDVYIDNRKLIDIFYPVGAIFQSTNSASPSTFMGGTWERFGNGKVLVGVDESDTDFATAEKNGGGKTHKLGEPNLPARAAFLTSAPGGAISYATWNSGNVDKGKFILTDLYDVPNKEYERPISNLQPYTTVYMWKRTA